MLNAMPGIPTKITVRAIARGGKFLGDDIGGAEITIRDVRSGEIFATGRTHGGSGPAGVMTTAITRTQPIPVSDPPSNDACRFDATLNLDEPRLIEISAFGPLGGQQSANRVTATTWVYPGKDISPDGTLREDGFLIEIPGLLVEVLQPPAHYLPYKPNPADTIQIRANVTMMCGCPIAANPWHGSPSIWPTSDFDVVASVAGDNKVTEYSLDFDPNAEGNAPSQFFTDKWVPGTAGVYDITVFAYQKSTGNSGVDRTTVNLG